MNQYLLCGTFTCQRCILIKQGVEAELAAYVNEDVIPRTESRPMPSSGLDELWPADEPTNDMTTGISGDTKFSIGLYRYQPILASTGRYQIPVLVMW